MPSRRDNKLKIEKELAATMAKEQQARLKQLDKENLRNNERSRKEITKSASYGHLPLGDRLVPRKFLAGSKSMPSIRDKYKTPAEKHKEMMAKENTDKTSKRGSPLSKLLRR